MNATEHMIRRAIRLAMTGRGRVEPNPMVGCVLARDGRVIGEGYHTHFGEPHPEPQALADCMARGESPAGATAYVTLEPCCHVRKKTPPCAPRLIEAKIAKVVLGCLDPNPAVNGNGVAMLRAAGIDVSRVDPALEAECKQLIAPFLLRTCCRRPYVTLKWAETADGKIAGPGGSRLQITGEPANQLVHLLRSRSDAIMVGVNTVLADDPQLTARGVEHSRLHTRIILDSKLRAPANARIFLASGEKERTIIFHSPAAAANPPADERISRLLNAGAQLILRGENPNDRLSLTDVFEHSLLSDLSDLMVEPGPAVAQSFFESGLAHRLWIFRSARRVNDDSAPSAIKVPSEYVVTGHMKIGDDVLTEYLDTKSDAFFAAVPSADFVLAAEALM